MADDFEITFEKIEELQERLEEVRAAYPYKEEEILQKLGRKLKSSSQEKTPLGPNKYGTDKHPIHIRNQYKLSRIQYDADGSYITLTNTSPLFHLLEKGHKMVVGGRTVVGKRGRRRGDREGTVVGFVPGKHMVERSMIELDQEMPPILEKWLDKVLGDLE